METEGLKGLTKKGLLTIRGTFIENPGNSNCVLRKTILL